MDKKSIKESLEALEKQKKRQEKELNIKAARMTQKLIDALKRRQNEPKN